MPHPLSHRSLILRQLGLALVALLLIPLGTPAAPLLNVSFDISRELFTDLNTAFEASWKSNQTNRGPAPQIRQSHAGSSKQARAVIDGLDADVVTLNQATDMDAIAARGLIDREWRSKYPNQSAPYSSTIVFLVRKGNPKNLKDWEDLVRPGISVVVPNPKTSGNGRYSYLAAYAYARLRLGQTEDNAKTFVATLFRNAPVLDSGGRGATTTFAQRSIGDALLTFEAEAHLAVKELGSSEIEIVRPSYSVDAEMPVALVEKVTRKKGNETLARAYLDFLYSDAAQEIIAQHHFRPSNPVILARHASRFGETTLFKVEEVFGPWAEVQKTHFADGGVFDQIYDNSRKR